MRLLHTGDWHIGKTLRGRSRVAEFEAVLDEIVENVVHEKIDVVLIAGDLFDTAAPTAESEQVAYRALLHLAKVAEHVVLIAGNHDNHRKFGAIKPLLELTNIHVAPSVIRPDEGGVLDLEIQKGGKLRISLLPFVSQRGIVTADDLMAHDADEHSMSYADRLVRVIGALTCDPLADAVNILLGHAMVHGGKLGGGERDAHTIFEYSIPTSAFPSHLHYVALGHLHRCQKLEAACPVYFSGSILQLDFGEEEDTKSVNVIEAVPGKPSQIDQIPLTAGKRLRTVKGTLEEIQALADQEQGDYLRVHLNEQPRIGLADEVRQMLPDAVEVRVASADFEASKKKDRTFDTQSPLDLFRRYLAEQNANEEAVFDLFKELLGDEDAA